MHLQQTLGWFEAVAKLSSFAWPSQKTLHRTWGESSTMVMIKTNRVSLNNIFSLSFCPFCLIVGKQFLSTKMYSFVGLLVTPSYGFSLSISKVFYLMRRFFYDILLAKLWAHIMVYSPRKANTSHLLWTNCHALMRCALSKSYLVQLLHTIFIIQHWIMWTDVEFVKCFTSVRSPNVSILP